MKKIYLLICIATILSGWDCAKKKTPSDSRTESLSISSTQRWLGYKNPEEAGFDSIKIQEIRDYFSSSDMASLLVVYKGKVLLALGDYERRYLCASIRKSLVNSVFGIYFDRGVINLDMTLDELGIDDVHSLTMLEKQATIRHLLQSRSGIYHPAVYETQSMKKSKPDRGKYEPGKHWYYNNWDFNALNTIFRKITSKGVIEVFNKRIASTIGLENYQEIDAHYYLDTTVSEHPACSFKMSALDLARFGQLYLQEGTWDGKSILSSEWIRESTCSYSETGTVRGGYGYLWWIPEIADSLHCFTACGVGTQVVLIVKELDLIIVQRVNTYRGERHYFDIDLYQKIIRAKNKPDISNPELLSLPEKEAPIYLIKERKFFLGDYMYTDGIYSVDKYKEGLIIKYPKGLKSRLIQIDHNRFRVEDVGEIIELLKTHSSKTGKLVLIEVLE